MGISETAAMSNTQQPTSPAVRQAGTYHYEYVVSPCGCSYMSKKEALYVVENFSRENHNSISRKRVAN